MQPLTIASIVFACVFASALLGMLLRRVVPEHHVNQDSKDVVKLAMGLLATMAALVLGLLTASAKSSFDTLDSEVQQSAAHLVMLDRVLAQYGPETKETRDQIRKAVAHRIELTWPEDSSRPTRVDAPEMTPAIEGLQSRIRALAPQNDAQRDLQSKALSLIGDLTATRWLVFAQAGTSVPMTFLFVLVLWLAVLFISFGLLAPRNATVIVALLLCALSVAGSIFLILEMSHPLEGFIKISDVPLRYALAHMGQ
jgi:hypothetical protein